jgi:hypothetical protein
MTLINRLFAVAAVIAVAVAFPLTAGATQPASVQVPTNDVEVFVGADSPCPFDITFTGTGTVTMTTFYDNAGTPVRQSIHGALMHTISSAFHTLVSNGPAPVHVDLATGQMVITGKEFAFHVPDASYSPPTTASSRSTAAPSSTSRPSAPRSPRDGGPRRASRSSQLVTAK